MVTIAKKSRRIFKVRRSGFSLAEILCVLTIAAGVLAAALGIYNRVQSVAFSIRERIETPALAGEILQRIAEDLDRLGFGAQTTIEVRNKYDKGFASAYLMIKQSVLDSEGIPQVLEQIIWQTNYDPDTNSLILYRSHKGLTLEDKVLDEKKTELELSMFVPLCSDITYFKIEIPKGEEEFLDRWADEKLPNAVTIAISFTEPFASPAGGLEVYDEDKIIRTIAIDRTRKIKFDFVKTEFDLEESDPKKTNLDEDEESTKTDGSESDMQKATNEQD